jgi:tRNA-2-methylthio-N6-dimethylallyladenosine synthase
VRLNTFFIETWGCQMNRHDSERIDGELRRHGLLPADDPSLADLVVLNTCAVRDKPVRKIMSRLGVLERLPRRPVVAVCGCVAEQKAGRLVVRSPLVQLVLGPGQIHTIGAAVDQLRACGLQQVRVGFDGTKDEASFASYHQASASRCMVTVVEGCDQFCTFCVVPYTRGREVSRPLRAVIAEAQAAADAGIKEVELLGQTINAYRCPKTNARFPQLLAAVAKIPRLHRVRYITSHPRYFSDELIQVLADHPNVSRYLHLPFQAGSDRVLARMKRRHTSAEYRSLVSRIRAAVPEILISTDVIVGFPGETEADFAQSLTLIEDLQFGQVFAFAYSPRPETPAARYPDQIPLSERQERLQRLFAVSDAVTSQLNRSLVGSTVKVLIDGNSRRSVCDWQGRGEDNRVVNFPKSNGQRVGDIVEVTITSAGPHSLYGVSVSASALPVLS